MRPEPGERGAAGPLPEDAACLLRMSAALAAGDAAAVGRELRWAAANVDPQEVDEAIVQSCLFVGFPAALDAASQWRRLRGDAPVERDPLAGAGRAAERAERGEALCRAIYGSVYDALRRSVADASPALDRLMVEVGYGTVLGRPGLDVVRRELCLVAILAAQDRARQLHSHLRGALRVGAPAGRVLAALEIGLARAPEAARSRLRRVWDRVVGDTVEQAETEERDVR